MLYVHMDHFRLPDKLKDSGFFFLKIRERLLFIIRSTWRLTVHSC